MNRLAVPTLKASVIGGLLAITSPSVFAQCETLVVTNPFPADLDLFGWSVAVDGNTSAYGAIGGDLGCAGGADCNQGSVQMIEDLGNSFRAQHLSASDGQPGDQFGQHVSVDGDTLAVGAHFAHEGKVYMFTRTAGTWSEQQILQASDGAHHFHFGHSLELDGDTLLVGSMQDTHAGTHSGSAQIFGLSGGVWVEVAKLTASDAAPQELFGRATDLMGGIAIVGAHLDDVNGNNAGAAYLFEQDDRGTPGDPTDDLWPEIVKLSPSAPVAEARFGLGVAVHGDMAAVGAPRDVTNGVGQGAVYIFERDSMGWTETQRLSPAGLEDADQFGESVVMDGQRLLVGARGDDDGGPESGAVYVFERDAGAWKQTGKYVPSDAGPSDLTGREMSVALDGDVAVVGSPVRSGAASQAGAATLLDLSGCLGVSACVGAPNSTGSVGTIAGRGTVLASANDLTLDATGLPAQVFGLFIVSRTPDFVANVAGGEGNLCLGGSIGRYNAFIQSTGAAGLATLPVNVDEIAAPNGTIQGLPGESYYFQFWHRDVVTGTATSNLTESVRISLR